MSCSRVFLSFLLFSALAACERFASEPASTARQPAPLAFHEVRNEALGFTLQLPNDVTEGSCTSTSCLWRATTASFQVERLGASVVSLDDALATVNGRHDVLTERATPGGGLMLTKMRGVIWNLSRGPHGWVRVLCRIGAGDSYGHDSMGFPALVVQSTETACASLRFLP